MRFRYVLFLIVTIASANGCATVADYRFAYSQKWLAWSAWHSAKHDIAEQKVCRDFGKGYRAGFLDVARGGDGTAPPVAPKEYWTAKYNGCTGCTDAISLWYEGFSRGAHDAFSGNYRDCYDVPSNAGCMCSSVECECGLETNQVVNSAVRLADQQHIPQGQTLQQTSPEPSQTPPAINESIQPKVEELRGPAETSVQPIIQPQDGL